MGETNIDPRFGFSLRWKIILPFLLLAILVGLGVAVIATRTLGEAEEVRFYRQVLDSGQQAADEVVRAEDRLLEIQRAVANTEGVAEAVAVGDAESLRSRVLQLVVNSGVDMVVILERDGTSLLAIRRTSPDAPPGDYLTLRGEAFYAEWPFIRKILELDGEQGGDELGDKQVGLHMILLDDDEEQVFMIGGPLRGETGRIFGAVIVGEYLTNMVGQLGEVANAHVSLYDTTTGSNLETDFDSPDSWNPPGLALTPSLITAAREPEDDEQPFRTIEVAGQRYGEVLSPFLARQGTAELGIWGASLLGGVDPDAAYREYQETNRIILQYGAITLALVLLTGLMVSAWITRPIRRLTEASSAVASGQLDTHVPESGRDELATLARTFNSMVTEIREESLYRSILGRSPDPESKEQLQKTLALTQDLSAGQRVRATVLSCELRGHATERTSSDPSKVMLAVNQVMDGLIPILEVHGGILMTISGDHVLAHFGVLPKQLPNQVSALQATHAGMEVLDFLYRLNERRTAAGLHALDLGIGVASGWAIAGGVGESDYLRYTVVGETVGSAERIMEATRNIGGSVVLISETVHEYLSGGRSDFKFGRFGKASLPDEGKEIGIYEVVGRSSQLVDCSEIELDEGSEWPLEEDGSE